MTATNNDSKVHTMRTVPLFAILLLCLVGPAFGLEGLAESDRDSWLSGDKAQHAAGGAIIGGVGYLLADEIHPHWPEWKKVTAGIAAAAVVGLVKEVVDSQQPDRHCTSAKDFLATTAGGAVGALSISVLFRF